MALDITSPAFPSMGEIPVRHTCDGEDRAPALAWTGVPEDARSLVLIVDDPDAPDPAAPTRTYVHWVLVDLPPSSTGLPDGATSRMLPAGTHEGRNDWGRTGYGGPCPPIGRHRYFFRLYALDTRLDARHHPTRAEVDRAMSGHVLAAAELVGTYERRGKGHAPGRRGAGVGTR